jgi:prolipoprotein diacylglyceryltransferase
MLALERLLVEFLRAKDDRFFGDFTLAQVISVLVLLAAAALAWTRWRHRPGHPEAEQPAPSSAAL